jgi:hypothetical protein
LSVVITVEAFAEMETVLRLWVLGEREGPSEDEFIEDEDDMADEKLATP